MFLESPWQVPHGTRASGPCRIKYELRGVRIEVDAIDVDDVPFESCDPVREFPAWPGKRHYSGALWMERSGQQVPFESLAERTCLIELDRTPGVAFVSSQPMWIQWGGEQPGEHVPDYFVSFDKGAMRSLRVGREFRERSHRHRQKLAEDDNHGARADGDVSAPTGIHETPTDREECP